MNGAPATARRDNWGLLQFGLQQPAAPSGELDAVFRQSLVVPGGIVAIDVRTPAALSVVVESVDEAGWWLEPLLGGAAFRTALELAELDVPAERRVELVDTELATTASRLLQLVWMRRWWPDPVPIEWLLDAELGLEAWRAEVLLGDTALAAAALTPVRGDLALHIAATGVLDEPADDLTTRTVLAATRAALDTTEMDATHEVLDDVYAAYLSHEAAPDAPPATRRDYALVAGGEGHEDLAPVAKGSIEVDVRMVHPRSVDLDGAAWEVYADGDRWRLAVEVGTERSTFIDPDDVLVAEIRIGESPVVVANLSRATRAFRGEVVFDAPAAEHEIEVLLYSPRHGLSGRRDLTELDPKTVLAAVLAYRDDRVSSERSFAFES